MATVGSTEGWSVGKMLGGNVCARDDTMVEYEVPVPGADDLGAEPVIEGTVVI